VDAAASRTILAGTDYQLSVSLKGTAVNISINGQVALAFSFNGAVVDGSFGLLSRNGSSSFDAVTVEAGELATSTPGGNGAPLATNDNGRTNPNTPLIIAVLANDSDANGDALTVTALTQPTSGTAVLNPIGTVTYTPNAGFTGTDTFTYKASDGTNESNVIYANTTAQSITDGGVLTSTIAISDSFTIADINVTLDITHTRDSDLQIFLRGPDGTVIQLFNGKGVSGQNLRNTVFDDEAATSITAASAPFTGTFRPLQSLSALDGKLAAGTWTLEVHDTVKKQTGTLNSWSLGITG